MTKKGDIACHMNNIIEFLNICDDDIEEYKTEIRDYTRIIQSNKLITRFAPINPGDPVTNIFFYSALLWSYSYSYLYSYLYFYAPFTYPPLFVLPLFFPSISALSTYTLYSYLYSYSFIPTPSLPTPYYSPLYMYT